MWSLIGSQIGSPDYNPRLWQGILHEPDWDGVQHQHQPVQPVQPISQHYDYSVNMGDVTAADPSSLQQQMKAEQMSRYYTVAGGLPAPSIGSP